MSTLPRYVPPPFVTALMLPFVVADAATLANLNVEFIDLGLAVALDPVSGLAIPQDNTGTYPVAGPLPCIGVSVNAAGPGDIVYVQLAGELEVLAGGAAILKGEFVGDSNGSGKMQSMGFPPVVLGSTPFSIAGIALEDSDGITPFRMLVQPIYAAEVPSGGATVTSFKGRTGAVVPTTGDYDTTQISGFVDAEVPTTFNTNADYDLAQNPNPLSSLQVFINSEAVPKPGQDRLLVQGTDYQLVAGTHGSSARIHYLVTPTATNSIVCWYRK